jgi:hypothetical protein
MEHQFKVGEKAYVIFFPQVEVIEFSVTESRDIDIKGRTVPAWQAVLPWFFPSAAKAIQDDMERITTRLKNNQEEIVKCQSRLAKLVRIQAELEQAEANGEMMG